MNTEAKGPPSWRVTAAARTGARGHEAAARVAARLGLRQVRRGNQSLRALARRHGASGWLIVHPDRGLSAQTPEGTPWRWHPGLARTRVASPGQDGLLQALALPTGARLLDGTLGQAHDALVAAAAGLSVHGLEADPIVHALTSDGLRRCADPLLADAAARISTTHAEHGAWLRAQAADSADAVLLAPMYLGPEFDAADLVQLREVGRHGWPSEATLAEALRVAPVCVLKVEPGRHPPVPGVARVVGGRRRVAWLRLERG